MLNGNVKQSAEATQLFDIMQRGRSPEQLKDVAIVCIGRFDQLLTAESSDTGLTRLQDIFGGLDDDTVLAGTRELARFAENEKRYVPAEKVNERIIPICPSLAAVTLSEDSRLAGIDRGDTAWIAKRRRDMQAS